MTKSPPLNFLIFLALATVGVTFLTKTTVTLASILFGIVCLKKLGLVAVVSNSDYVTHKTRYVDAVIKIKGFGYLLMYLIIACILAIRLL